MLVNSKRSYNLQFTNAETEAQEIVVGQVLTPAKKGLKSSSWHNQPQLSPPVMPVKCGEG